MSTARQRAAGRKRNIVRNGALLVISEAAKLVNIPLAQDVARHVQHAVSSLKVPNENDLSAQILTNRIEALVDVVNTAFRQLDRARLIQAGTRDRMVIELLRLQSHLADASVELHDIQNSQYLAKFASQAQIQERIIQLKEELSHTLVDTTLRLLVDVLAFNTDKQLEVAHPFNSTACQHHVLLRKYNTFTTKHNTLARVTQRRQRRSDKRIRGLEREYEGLKDQVNAVLLMRRSDNQWIRFLILLNGACVFFSDAYEQRAT
ncbi:hypothetical protein B0J17DRAFT_706744 [Rhizoctonia solani]|nr:hypothetical protein B0J17DRAFT_706744 [Rhizoctonia solani]